MKNVSTKQIIKIALLVLGVAFIALVAFRKFIFPADSFFYNVYEEAMATNILAKLFKTAVIVVIGILVIKVANLVTVFGDKFNNNTYKTATLLIGNVLKYASAVAIVLVSLGAWGIDTTAIVTGAGVITLIVGLGCQAMVSDIVSGIFMLFEGDIKVGDVVVVNGWRGTVQQIGLRRTRIIDTVGNINIVNNSSISNIINNTRELSFAIIEVGIEYDESIERVESVLAKNFAEMKKNIPAIIEGPFYKGVSALGESSVNIKILAKCKEQDKFQTERDLNREVKLLFDKYNINIPFNQMVLSYRNESATKTLSAQDIALAKKFLEEQKALSKNYDEQDN